MIRPFRPYLFALACAALCLVSNPAHAARSISSDPSQPDSMRTRSSAPMRVLPVWVGTETFFALERSRWDGNEWRGGTMRFGVSLSFPSVRVNEREWAVFSFEDETLGIPVLVVTHYDSLFYPHYGSAERRVSATLFAGRFGHDRLFGREARPHSFVGLGVGFGGGSVSDLYGGDPDHWLAYEIVVRAGAYAYPYRRARIGAVAQGVFGYRVINERRRDGHIQALLGLLLEAPIEIPRRFAGND